MYKVIIRKSEKIVFGCINCGEMCLFQTYIETDCPVDAIRDQTRAALLLMRKQAPICKRNKCPMPITLQSHYCQNEKLKMILKEMGGV